MVCVWVAVHVSHVVAATVFAATAVRNVFSLFSGWGSLSGISSFLSRVTSARGADFTGIDGRSDGAKRFLDAVRDRESPKIAPAPLSFNAWVNTNELEAMSGALVLACPPQRNLRFW